VAKENIRQQWEAAIAQIDDGRTENAVIWSAIDELDRHHLISDCLDRRKQLLESTEEDPDLIEAILAQCASDPAQWVKDWVWTYDPRRSPAVIPMNLFDRQSAYLYWRQERRSRKEHGLIEKSRDMGLTWLNCCAQLHAWLFESGYKGTVGSRKEMLVDRIGDPDSIFEKMRFIIRYLPDWMRPQNYSDGSLKLINKDKGCSITGEAGDNMGRGGRSSVYDVDEAAFIERAERVDAAISQNTEVVFYTSTPNGPGNPFAQKRLSGKIEVFTFHWRDDPRKDDKWYQKQVSTLDPVIVAQEIDIDYNASIEGVTIPHKWVLAAINLDLPMRGDQTAGLDIADEGKDSNVLIARHGPVVTDIESWGEGNTTQTAYKTIELARTLQFAHLNYDAIGVGAGVGGTLSSADHLPFTIQPINGSGAVSDTVWSEFDDRTSSEIFKNLRAELWWLLRRRFEKTYEHVNGLATYPLDELISIPNHPMLIAQLSQPLRKFNESGKIVIESKEDMARRGIKSPDYADALVYAFARYLNAAWWSQI
jgi:phage terminase large subunit